MGKKASPVASIRRGDKGNQVDDYKITVNQYRGKPAWKIPPERTQILLRARMRTPYKGDTADEKNMANIWIGMTREYAEKVAIAMLRECYKDEHPSVRRLLDLLEGSEK